MSKFGPRRTRVLVAVHEAATRAFLVDTLRDEDFDTIQVDQGHDALAWWRTGLIDVAVMEAGIFAESFMSGLHESGQLVVCSKQESAPRQLGKPINRQELLAAVRQAAERPTSVDSPDIRPEPATHELDPQERLNFFGTLAAGVVHDFNNLLTVILGAGELLADRIAADHPQRVFIEQIQQAAHKGTALVHQLKALSKNQLPRLCRMDLNDTLTKIQPLIRNLLGPHVQFETHLAPDLAPIHADPGQIGQVIINLALNARDALPAPGGTFRLTTSTLVVEEPLQEIEVIAAGSYIVLSVADTGAGMDEATQQRLFEPFFTTKPAGRGSGLGLANVHSILHCCNAHITVASQRGAGTTFSIFFPSCR